MDEDELFKLIVEAKDTYNVPIYSTETGFSLKGIDLGSNNFRAMEQPKTAMLIGEGTSSYEAGEVWHLLDTRIDMPITKIRMSSFRRADLDDYNTLVMVSGSYPSLDSIQRDRLKSWISKGRTLVTIGGASQWAIKSKLVKEKLVEKPKDSTETRVERLPYVDANENIGKEQLGGAIFNVDLDITHPIGFGYRRTELPIYKNNNVFMAPSKNAYATVAAYTKDPHVDGFISEDNLETYLKKSASIIVSPIGRGRVVLFADNPNFRGAWYGTNKLFLNALFLGNHISVPQSAN